MRQISVFGVRLDDVTENELQVRFSAMMNGSHSNLVVTPNPEFLLTARTHHQFRKTLNASALSLPDGAGILFAASALSGMHRIHRHTGVDTLPILATMCQERGVTLVLLGATPVILERTKQRFATLAEGIKIISINPGIIQADHAELPLSVLASLRIIGPCVIAVALGQSNGKTQGKQETVCAQIVANIPNAKIVIGVGGAFDVLSGSVRRAPTLFRRLGMEWLWRVIIEPWRFKRILRAVVLFPIFVAYDTLRKGRFLRACFHVAIELVLLFLPQKNHR